MNDFSNKMVMITGASSGIGLEFARVFAQEGCHLILVARSSDKLHQAANELGVPCEVLPADLSKEDEVRRIAEIAKGQGVDALINCAGFGILGTEAETSLSDELSMIQLNVVAMHMLTKTFLPQLCEKNSGAILNVASVAGLLPGGPHMNTYYATKAYVASFTEGLACELRESGSDVYVGALCPGPVKTNFMVNAGATEGFGIGVEECVAYAMKKMRKGKTLIVPSAKVRFGLFMTRFLPRSLVLKFVGSFQKNKK